VSGLPWVRLDSNFPWNPKVVALTLEKEGHRALAVYTFGLAFSGSHGSDGFIPKHMLGLIHGRPADARKLVEHRFWLPTDGGWTINGWDEKQPSTEETQRRRKRAQDAAAVRWAKAKEGGDGLQAS
jgi:hypothetical protein